jgi:osmoprotectant transport system ATP-binding protein
VIEFESVSKTYRDGTHAVADLSLDVPTGKITVFVGPSGCGKTTTLRMVNRMLEPTSGRILWDGAPLKSKRRTTLRRQMGYVIQSGGLFPHRTVLENIGTVPGLLGWQKPKIRSRGLELLDAVGLDRKLGERYPAQLSGGQQQRVGVARALAADPLVMLMDEPFSAVDPIVRYELQREILRLQSELNKTIVFVTHDIDEAIRLADRVAVFGPGGVLQQYDEPAHLLSRPANDFVARMIGAGRGYRWLQFLDATNLPIHHLATITDTAAVGDEQLREGWLLVVKPDGAPLGWIDANGMRKLRDGASLRDSVTSVGAVFRPGANLSQALDAALSSPAAMGVAVDNAGKVTGGVRAGDVLAALETQRRN